MKKTLAIVLTLMLALTLCVGLTACNGGVEGDYKFQSMTMKYGPMTMEIEAGKEIDMGDLGKMTVEADAFVLSLNADKTLKFVMDFMGEKATMEGTWEQKDGKLMLTIDGDTQEAVLTGKVISFEQNGMALKLSK